MHIAHRPFRRLCLLAGLLGAWLPGSARATETGIPAINLYSVRDYMEHNQTWCAVQDRAGTLYVGNKNCVLTYDGHTWGTIPIDGLFIRGLALDAQDRIWVGGVGELGYLEDNGRGGRDYVSLRSHLPPADQGTLPIFQCLFLPHGIYFVTASNVLRWHQDRLSVVLDQQVLGWTTGRELWTHGRNQPLRVFDGQVWREEIPAEPIADSWVMFGARLPDQSTLLLTRDHGILRWAHRQLEPWNNELAATLQAARLQNAIQLRDGSLAIATRRAGTYVLDLSGHLRGSFDTGSGGLTSNWTLRPFEDRSGDLWLLQNSGLARVNWPAAVTYFDQRRGLGTSSVKTILRHQGRLYVGTNDGLFILQPEHLEGLALIPAHFEPIAGANEQVWALASAGNELLIGGPGGLRSLAPTPPGEAPTARFIRAGPFVVSLVVPRDHPDQLWVGGNDRLELMTRTTGGWRETLTVPTIDQQVRSLLEDEQHAIWAAVTGRGYYRITFPATASTPSLDTLEVHAFLGGNGLPSDHLSGIPALTLRGGQVVVLDDERLFTFDRNAGQFQPLPLPLLEPAGIKRTVRTAAAGLDAGLWVRTFRTDADAGPWRGRVYWHLPQTGPSQPLPFAVADAVGENPAIFEERGPAGSVVWIGGSEGLARAELPQAYVAPRAFATRLQRAAAGDRDLDLHAGPATKLPFDHQGLKLTFGTDRLDDRYMRYQSRIVDLDETWSALSATAELALNHLPAGLHTIAIRARDADGRLGAPATFAYNILPPWWQTWWARTGGLLTVLGLLSAGVRHRLGAVQRRNRQLESLVEERTQELRSNEVQLTAARDAANAANRAKSDFLASMSHELRTPLNAILGFAQILHRDQGLAPKSRHQLDIIDRNGRHLLELINEVLDLSKIEAHKLALQLAPCSLRRLATELAATFEPRATEKGLTFELELDRTIGHVQVDEAKLRQVLVNLLANAVKFTRRGQVVLAIQREQDRIHFAVRDTGVGIVATDLVSVFEPFHQSPVDPALTGSDGSGTGLGLPISQRLVKLMGGCIEVASTPGEGSRFSFSLDLPTAPASAAPAATERIIGYTGPRRRVLVVDDVKTNRAVLRELLTVIGFEIDEAGSGEDALVQFARHRADLVLLDLRLPGIAGEEVARQLQQDQTDPPKIIAVSASVFDLNEGNIHRVHCHAFVPKPFNETHLLATIARLLDLTWQTQPIVPLPMSLQDSAAPFRTPVEIARLPRPAAEEIKQWLELARRADQRRLREAIAAEHASGPEAEFRHEIDRLLQRFQTGAVREILTLALQTPPDPASPS